MAVITDLKDALNTKTVHLVLLSIVTAGIYPLMWMYQNTAVIERITKGQIADRTFIIWLAICAGLGAAFSGTASVGVNLIGGLLSIASWVLYIVWAFKAKSALQEYALTEHRLDLRLNWFYTLLFTVYYINYCANDLSEDKRRQDIVQGQHLAAANVQASPEASQPADGAQ